MRGNGEFPVIENDNPHDCVEYMGSLVPTESDVELMKKQALRDEKGGETI